MAKTSLIAKSQRAPKFSTRQYRRCKLCGRPRGYLRKFELFEFTDTCFALWTDFLAKEVGTSPEA